MTFDHFIFKFTRASNNVEKNKASTQIDNKVKKAMKKQEIQKKKKDCKSDLSISRLADQLFQTISITKMMS